MPGRAGSEVPALDQGNILPAIPREVVEHTGADYATAYKQSLHMGSHKCSSGVSGFCPERMQMNKADK